MIRKLSLLTLLFAVPCFGQAVTPAPTPAPTTLFHLETGVSSTFINGKTSTTATLVDAWLPVKAQNKGNPGIAIMYRQYIVPVWQGQSYQMGGEFRWNAGQFTKAGTMWGVINPSYLTLFVNATAGSWRTQIAATSTAPAMQSPASFAAAISGGLSYKLPSSIVGQMPASLRAEFGLFHGNKQTTPFGSLNDPTGILGVTFTF